MLASGGRESSRFELYVSRGLGGLGALGAVRALRVVGFKGFQLLLEGFWMFGVSGLREHLRKGLGPRR